MRVEAFIEMFQGSWDKVAGWMDDFEGTENYKLALKDIAKRQLVNTDLGHIIHPHSTIIYNSTQFPFITSDNPVARRQINITDALGIIPKRYLKDLEDESTEFAFFFFPMSPQIAYVSCGLLKRDQHINYSDIDLENIFYLNWFTIINSYSKVYSPVMEPLKGEVHLSKLLSSRDDCSVVKIYTRSKRIISVGSITTDSIDSMTLKIEDLEQVKLINDNEQLKLIEVIDCGVNTRMMRQGVVSKVDHENGVIVVESNIKLST